MLLLYSSSQVLCRWILSVRKNYRPVKYHNWRHALNVCQTMFTVLKTGKMDFFMNDLEVSTNHHHNRNVAYTESGTPMLNWDSQYLCHFSTEWLKFGLQAHLFKMFGHAKFQLSIYCTFIVTKVFVVHLVIFTKCFITIKVQEIES